MAQLASTLITRCQNYGDDSDGQLDDSDWILYLNDWVRKASSEYNLPWARRTTPLLVYEGVYEYSLPSDFRQIIEPELPISEDRRNDAFVLFQNQRSFARNKTPGRNDAAIQHVRGTKYLALRYIPTQSGSTVLHDCDSVSDNGTWSVSGASGLAADSRLFREGAASLLFNVTASGTVTLTSSSMSAVNLTDYEDKSRLFLWVYLPTTGTTGITLRWGNDSSNYFSVTATTNHNGSSFGTGWNLIGFEWNGATETGSVDVTAIDYVVVSFAAAAIGNGYRVDGVVCRLPTEFDLNYYSLHTVLDNDGTTYKELLVDVDDQLIGDSEFEDCAVYWAVFQAAKYKLKNAEILQGALSDFNERFMGLKARYPDLAPYPQVSYIASKIINAV